jgi:hypothetical protein
LRYPIAAAPPFLRQHVHSVWPELERLYLNDLMRTHDAAEGIAVPQWADR